MECPDCNQTLHNSARYCGCGWKRDNSYHQQDVFVPCAFDNCIQSAKVKKLRPTGWANLFYEHSDKLRMDDAHANLDKYGLALLPDETKPEHVARMREFFRAGFKGFKTKSTAYKQKQTIDWENDDLKALVRDFSTDEGMTP